MEFFGFDILSLFSWANIFALLIGTFAGMLIGALPGMGAPLAIVLLLPLTYNMDPLAAILMLLATYQSAEYGGSISAIILGIPGTPAAAATVLDGNALAKKSSPGKALAYSLTASTIGGIFGALVLIFLSVPLAKLAIAMSDPEFFLIGVLGLIAVAGLGSEDITKGLISVVLGLMAGTVGIDAITGSTRFTLGRLELMDGISIIALLIGTFAFSEILSMVSNDLNKKYITEKKGLQTKLSMKELKDVSKSIGIGSTIGSIVGILPGLGAGTASWFSYITTKRRSKNPESFGKGNPEGITSAESANNATVGGALVPLMTLGIPGSPTMAIIMGAFIIHGLQPGPNLFKTETELVYGIFYGFLLTTIAMFILGKLITPVFSRALTVPNPILVPIVLALTIGGAYAARYLFFDLWFALAIGFISYFLVKLKYSLPSFVVAFVLSPIIEISLRRSLIISHGSYDIFFTRLYSIIILLIILGVVIASIAKKVKEKGTTSSNVI